VTNSSIPSIAQTFKVGDKLAGCYTLKETMPTQGCCFVWLAHDDELNKDIVLHFVPDSVAADTRAMAELKQEAKRNRQLIHPRIIRVHDLVEDEKWAAISMDYVQGETLAALQAERNNNPFNPTELAQGIAELCQTVEDAHRIDLFHRDLSPENIVATGNGVMVQKFGISRVILDSLARGGQKIEGNRDVAYMSPQQLDGERPSRADDIYSLGASIFDLLAGAPPFVEGDLVPQIRKTVPPPASERRTARGIAGDSIPKAWEDVIAACLAKNAEDRPKSVAEVGTRFASAKPGAATAASSPAASGEVAAEAAAVTGAAAAASKPEEPGAPAAAPEPSKPAQPEKETSPAKQQKRPWTPGPGKAPLITEATVLSKTAVPKGDAKADSKSDAKSAPKTDTDKAATPAKPAEPMITAAAGSGGGTKKPGTGGPGGPTTPTGFPLRAFVEVEGDAKRPKSKSSAGLVAGGVVLLLILIVGYLVAKSGPGNEPDSAVATSGTNATTAPDASESTASPIPVAAASPVSSPVNVAAVTAPSPAEVATDSPAPSAAPAESAPPAVAESPAPPVVIPPTITDAQAQQIVADKTKAVDQAKAALADAEKAAQAKAAAQAQAASASQQAQGTIKQKADAAAAAKKTADAAAAALKQQQDSLQKAEADAQAAQAVAAAKVQAADQLKKAVADAQAAAQQQQTAAQQAQADADQAAKTATESQQAAAAAAKAAADAEQARQQQAGALAQAQTALTQVQAGVEQARNNAKAQEAAAEAARIKKEREEAAEKAATQVAAAAKAAADAEKALDAAKKAVADAEKAQAEAEAQAEAARNGSLPAASPAASPGMAAPAGSPAATPPAGASASPAASPGGPTLSVHAPNPHMKVDQALSNSLGMRFAPVGHVFFSIWLTRVQDFEAFAKATGFENTSWQDPGFKQGPDHPVVNVSWNDANQFCLWLTQKEHHEGILAANETYRLPTDLEWSTAVGLPPETGHTPESRDMDVADVYPWGTEWPPPSGAGDYTGEETDSDVAIKGYNDGFAWTAPVGSFNANRFGLYDMGGNVWEWCMDWWNSEQTAKVLRGASWYNGALKLSLLSSCRERASADQRTDNYGFRVVIAQEMTKDKTARHHTE